MVAARLKDNQKREILEGYRSGKSTTSLAEEFGCSANTVNRTVKALLSEEEYLTLKAVRNRGGLLNSHISGARSDQLDQLQSRSEDEEFKSALATNADKGSIAAEHSGLNGKAEEIDLDEDRSGPLALDDADDFSSSSVEESADEEGCDIESQSSCDFQEVVPLNSGFTFSDRNEVACKQLSKGVLPVSVYMLVDKTVELDIRALKDFPELGSLNDDQLELKALCLFPNQRSAKRHCGRSQRVIKVPDTSVFELSLPYLKARGITHLVLEGLLISLLLETSSLSGQGNSL